MHFISNRDGIYLIETEYLAIQFLEATAISYDGCIYNLI